jgi:two-component system NtrC family response regulator
VVVITASADIDGAETAITNGAYDYIEKPASVRELLSSLEQILQFRKETHVSSSQAQGIKRDRIIGRSARINGCINLMKKSANSGANTMIIGETGTGKELFARGIHENSRFSDNSFVVVDCASLPENLVESMLFGHVKGAFTGAERNQDGLIAQADQGTLFLDEVGELPLDIQKKFLRVLEDQTVRRVGCNRMVKSRFKLIAATHRNLEEMVQKEKFRSDLLFRLQSLTITIPPLRERLEDLPELIEYTVARLCRGYGIKPKKVSKDFDEALNAYEWPGNVRELVNVINGAIAIAGSATTLFPQHLPVQMRVKMIRNTVRQGETCPDAGEASGDIPTLKKFRELNDKRYLDRLISITRGDVARASKISGLSKSRLYELLAKHGINS